MMGVASVMMLIPATHALALDLHRTAQPFFYSALLFGILTALIGLATYGKRKGNFDVYFEMVSSLTTTGASLIEPPSRVVSPIHLWRALVGWMGGYLILLAAIAVLAPLNLGGYEVLRPVSRSSSADKLMGSGDPTERILRFNRDLFPLYLTATMALWGLLVLPLGRVEPVAGQHLGGDADLHVPVSGDLAPDFYQ